MAHCTWQNLYSCHHVKIILCLTLDITVDRFIDFGSLSLIFSLTLCTRLCLVNGCSSDFKHLLCIRVFAGSTALHLASIAGMADVVDALIQKGATVSAADRQGYTALQRACQHNRVAVARMVIVQGNASPHRRVPNTGNVPLHLAAEFGHIETVQVRTLITCVIMWRAERRLPSLKVFIHQTETSSSITVRTKK